MEEKTIRSGNEEFLLCKQAVYVYEDNRFHDFWFNIRPGVLKILIPTCQRLIKTIYIHNLMAGRKCETQDIGDQKVYIEYYPGRSIEEIKFLLEEEMKTSLIRNLEEAK